MFFVHTSNVFAGEPKKCSHHNSQWKVILMLVTLISFYYHGSNLIISCFLLHGCSGASVDNLSNVNELHNQVLHHHHESHGYNDFYLQNHDDNEQRASRSAQHQLQSARSQANDIFTKMVQSQGRIHDHYNYVAANNRDFPGDGDARLNMPLRSHSSALGTVTVSNQQRNNGNAYTLFARRQLQQAISCKDEAGSDVNWFVAYKLPQISSSSDPLVHQGSKYFYLLPNSKEWKASTYPINGQESILAKTLDILWTKEFKDAASLFYNDQPPSEPAIVMNGHTKGVIMSSSGGGIWVQHSCPHFPDTMAENFSSSYPTGGLINGQMFFCVSLQNASSVDKIGLFLEYTRPFVYNHSIPASLEPSFPQLTRVAKLNETVKTAPWFTKASIDTGDLQLEVFAKGPKFRREIYSAWVAPEYEVGLDVQSWLNGPHPFMSNCTSNESPVFNVLMKKLAGQNFSHSDDHSKWAVSLNETKPVTCIGDLNRMKPQKTRGGVAICVTNVDIWNAFKSIVEETQTCNSTRLQKLSKHSKAKRFKKTTLLRSIRAQYSSAV